MSEKFRILSLDGGGIRGILTLQLLQRLEQAAPFLHTIDLFAGTSTGGIIALGLAAGLEPQQLLDLYCDIGPSIFSTSIWDSVRELHGTLGAPYDLTPLHAAIVDLVGDMRLRDLQAEILIPTFDLDNDCHVVRRSKPKFFHTFNSEDLDERISDIALRTSAAPSLFPVYQGFIDGGVIANNPSVCAIAESINPERGSRQLDDLYMLSLGTGHQPTHIDAVDDDWGGLQWSRYVMTIFVDGKDDVVDYQCRQFLQERYLRLNPTLPVPINPQDFHHIDTLADVGFLFDLQDSQSWLKTQFIRGIT